MQGSRTAGRKAGVMAVTLSGLMAAGPAMAQDQEWRLDMTPMPRLSSPGDRFTMELGGRAFYHLAFVDQDRPVTGADNVSNGRFRSARLGVDGIMFGAWDYKVELDFAGGDVVLADAVISVGSDRFTLTAGHQKPPVSLEELSSSKITTFMERGSITDAFNLNRQTGLTLFYGGSGWTVGGGLYGASPNEGDSDDGFTYAGRATVAPRIGDGLVHLGISYRHREAEEDRPIFNYRQRPHFSEADRFVSTAVDATGDDLVGLEAAAIFGPFAMESEYMRLKAEVPGDDPKFDGFFVSGSWFLTGESRPYKNGEFARVKVNRSVFRGGRGAIELAARYDTIDLTDGAYVGGTQDSYILGANWHMTNYLRLMANASYSEVSGGVNDGADIKGIGFRAQLDW